MQNKLMDLLQVVFIIFCLSVFSDTGAATAEMAADPGPENIILRSPSTSKAVKFPHREHQDRISCSACHHSSNAEGIKILYTGSMHIQKCVVCHNRENMISPKLNSFKLVAHGLCKECHKKNKDTAPTKCSGCHTDN